MVATYRARRRLQMSSDTWREPGELVPEAHTWFRLDSYLHTGHIVEAEVDEAEFRQAVREYCPQLAERVLDLAGLAGAQLEGPRKTPRKRAARRRVPAKSPALVKLKDA